MTISTNAIPRPPSAPPPPAHPIFDIATAVSDADYAFRIRHEGSERTLFGSRDADGSVKRKMMDRILRQIVSLTDENQVIIRCFSPEMRSYLLDRAPAGVMLADPMLFASAAAWSETARVELRAELRARFERRESSTVIYAASDASTHPSAGHGSGAWVTHTGEFRVLSAPSAIFYGELASAISFAQWLDRTYQYRRAVLFMDNLGAVTQLTTPGRPLHDYGMLAGVNTAYKLIEQGRLEPIWVRSHEGHPLNDVADRLALMGHRAFRDRVAAPQVAERGSRIVELALPQLAATNWADERARALNSWRSHLAAQSELAA